MTNNYDNKLISLDRCCVFPGFVDVHVHFREPGFCYKETIASGTAAAARGGYAAVCTMPNLAPVPDSTEALAVQLKAIRDTALINVFPYGSITEGEQGKALSDMDGLSPDVCAFSDDGKGVMSAELMEEAMLKAKSLGRIIAAHCEDTSLLDGGYIHNGQYALRHGHRGISSESEWKMIERDLRLAEKTGCAYHVCHISTRESVQLIRDAKKSNVDVTCETGPHYLTLCDEDLIEDGRFKMNPPLRSPSDRDALIEGVIDGTVDMIATDHAPHSAEEKGLGLEKSLMGVVGLETAFPVLYTKLVKTGIITLEKLINLMHDAPCARFGIELPFESNFTIFDLDASYTIDPADFASKGKSTPFAGDRVFGKCILTVCNGKTVYTAF